MEDKDAIHFYRELETEEPAAVALIRELLSLAAGYSLVRNEAQRFLNDMVSSNLGDSDTNINITGYDSVINAISDNHGVINTENAKEPFDCNASPIPSVAGPSCEPDAEALDLDSGRSDEVNPEPSSELNAEPSVDKSFCSETYHETRKFVHIYELIHPWPVDSSVVSCMFFYHVFN
ncbi:unnamed protein product [Absidia cylindrospora]